LPFIQPAAWLSYSLDPKITALSGAAAQSPKTKAYLSTFGLSKQRSIFSEPAITANLKVLLMNAVGGTALAGVGFSDEFLKDVAV
jgi:hypothetical protein